MNYWQWPEYNKESLYLTTSTDLGQNLIVQSRIYHDTFKNTLLMYKENPNLNQQIKKNSVTADMMITQTVLILN